MGVSAEIKVYAVSLGNNQTWKKLQPGTEADYNFIKALEDQVIGLAGNVQSDKAGGTIGHIGMVMPAPEFALIQGTTAFVLGSHPGIIDYLLPTPCTTAQHYVGRKYKHSEKTQVFKMERTLDEKLKAHIFSCFDEDDYMDLEKKIALDTQV